MNALVGLGLVSFLKTWYLKGNNEHKLEKRTTKLPNKLKYNKLKYLLKINHN
jgi:hypothetical protein